MKAKSLSANILKNTVLNWASHCASIENYRWTQHDSNAVFLINVYIRDAANENYLERKEKMKFTQTLDKMIFEIANEILKEIIRPITKDSGIGLDVWEISLSNYAKEHYNEVIKKILSKYGLHPDDCVKELAREMSLASIALYLLTHTNIYEIRIGSKL